MLALLPHAAADDFYPTRPESHLVGPAQPGWLFRTGCRRGLQG